MYKTIGFILPFLLIAASGFSQSLQTVDTVDLDKYAGTWYEIAAFPQRFQKGCHGTTATYSKTSKDYIIVKNKCRKDSLNGKESSIKGKAFIDPGTGNAKLKVQFFWPFKGKYWIIDLAEDYSYAVVGHPDRNYLWILSRTPQMKEGLYQEIVARIAKKDFDVSQLVKTVQAIHN
ncbi:lipocalin family protein [Lutimonas halocynthiae]|uniref:lipocalin family protein n=1 Tax=Lutimonas halocynthiae TaxID=1446477 RepID=UPI0025B2D986|nr:lipocalin family protein [Lutimonas halocynthiae]MDN3641143.1 lipocalin family protein [Lutimonas halocynthiae]